jgi:RHS repeat-associated protein
LEFAGGGWPVSSDTFYPYGQEQNPTADPNHYKFTGQERDSEANLDYFKARHYSFTAGRFMSPDPYDGSMNLNYPQTLNRYAYVGNNPLGYTDPTGLDGGIPFPGGGLGGCIGAAASGGGDILDDISCGITLGFDIAGLFSHPKFTGATRSRPNAHIWDEKQFPIHYGPNIAGALGLPSGGCEFGSCGESFQSPVLVGGAAAACIEAEPCGAIGGLILGGGIVYQIYAASRQESNFLDYVARAFCVDRKALGELIHQEKSGRPKGKKSDLAKDEIKALARLLPKLAGCTPTEH